MHVNIYDYILFTIFSPTCFRRYGGRLQGSVIITTIQSYKCGSMCRCHSVTIKNYYNFSYNYVSNINIGYKRVLIKLFGD
jgi:hypothetical protein